MTMRCSMFHMSAVMFVCMLWVEGPGILDAQEANMCPKSCVCQNKQAHCDAMSLSHMPYKLPLNLEALLMRNNLVRRVNSRHLAKLRNLKHLILKGNRIHRIEPDSFKNLRKLVSLSLTENKIRKLDLETFRTLTELRFLSLRSNRLRKIDEVFSRLYNLQLLNLGENRIRKITHKTFRHNWRLVILDLHNNQIHYVHKHAFRAMPHIKYLVLRDNPLVTLAVNFKPNIHLELLDFTNCQLTEIVQGLPYSINDLRLSENNITRINAKDFRNTRKIRLLVLNANQIEDIDEDAFSRMIQLYDIYISGNALKKLPSKLPKNLHGIYANRNNIIDLEAAPLTGIHSLEFLYLRHNNIRDIRKEALWNLGNLRSLDLSHNAIGDLKSMTFRGNKHLQRLDISRNPLLQLDRDSFVGLDNLHIFEMSSVGSKYDRSRINPAIFKDMKRLLFLDLSNSSQVVQGIADNPYSLDYMSSVEDLNLMDDNLLTLPSQFPAHFHNLRMIKLIRNPWHCDMDILWLAYWMRNHTVEFFAPYHMTCATPPELKDRLIIELTESDLLPVTRRKPYIKYIEISLEEFSGNTETEDTLDITRHPYQYPANYTTGHYTPPDITVKNLTLAQPGASKTYTTKVFPDRVTDEHADLITRYITPKRNIKIFAQNFKTVAPNFFDKRNKTKPVKPKRKKKKLAKKIDKGSKLYNYTKWKEKSHKDRLDNSVLGGLG